MICIAWSMSQHLLRLVSREGPRLNKPDYTATRLHAYPLSAFVLLFMFFRVDPKSGDRAIALKFSNHEWSDETIRRI